MLAVSFASWPTFLAIFPIFGPVFVKALKGKPVASCVEEVESLVGDLVWLLGCLAHDLQT